MFKFLFGFILLTLFSFANACDQPYVTIQDIKIGCPLENLYSDTNLILMEDDSPESNSEQNNREKYHDYIVQRSIRVAEDHFISGIRVTTLDNNIEYITFEIQPSEYLHESARYYNKLLTSMEKKWGIAEHFIPSQTADGHVFNKPHALLQDIFLALYDNGHITITYQSKKITDFWDQQNELKQLEHLKGF
ncbi:hypothetical protein [Wohlfahrtiimonas chitiniclastica]|uniref:hypothetical protein n=1 Tax=Wohlfahrtiimonas chitiniclastica TaxID=400946 RepID=UPI0007B6976D|nr:hypothetical protein [Wohlfahrtiimonas chitiniclastica]KZX36882.1 hypothetical protein A6V30_07145 [Wohlfahrtiimonas chitiniclastica]